MNEFSNRNPEGILFVLAIALCLSALLGFNIVDKHHTQAMADKGYVQQALPGTTNTIWVKDSVCY